MDDAEPTTHRHLGTTEDHLEPELFRALLADTIDLAAVIEVEGKVSYLNRAGHRLLLMPASTPPGTREVLDLLAPADHQVWVSEVLPTLASSDLWSGSLGVVTTTGTEVPTRSTLRRHHGPGGIERISWVARDVSTERAVYERLHKKVFEDELTGLPHRSIFLDRLDLALRRGPEHTSPVALIFVALDRFKEKNERHGREVGDELLRAVAARLDASRRPADTVARWGGDEFVLMCDGLSGPAEALDLAGRLVVAFEAPFPVSAGPVFLSASLGVATADAGETSTEELLSRAEAAGQLAKQRGGAAVHLFDAAMQARANRRAEIEDALRGAPERDELVLYYQPEVSLRTNEIVGVEALVRWHHPQWGLVAPAEFIPVAEASNLILDLGAWVVRTATEQCARWRDRLGDRTPMVSINISARQFAQDDMVEQLAGALEASGAEPADLCLEITESVLMDDVEVTTATLRRLKALGVQLAIDDFGTGYSSLSYLRRFPVDILKVDRSFVSGLGHDPEDSAIVQAVVHMGRALHLRTIAEGVETAHHLIELRELDCDLAQGYHFARPRPAEAVTRMLDAGPDWMAIA